MKGARPSLSQLRSFKTFLKHKKYDNLPIKGSNFDRRPVEREMRLLKAFFFFAILELQIFP